MDKDQEATMVKFLCGLNQEIQDHVEMYHYVELEDMVHMAIKVEQQLKTGGSTCIGHNSSSNIWKSSSSRREDKQKTFSTFKHKLKT